METEDYNDLKRMEEGDDDSSESDSDSSDEEDDHITLDDGALDRMEAKVMADPYNYESHKTYIEILRTVGNLQRLREARNTMNTYFPLPYYEWEKWIEDEERLATSPQEYEVVTSLYSRATKEYQWVSIWLKYAAFVEKINSPFENLKDPLPETTLTSLKKIREVWEQAVSSMGLNVKEGKAIWDGFRGFESKLLSALERFNKNKKTIEAQTDLIRNLFKRQLSIPHFGIEDTLKEYESWEEKRKGKSALKDVEKNYQNALKLLEERKEYEASIESSAPPDQPDYSKVEQWKAYLQFEQGLKNPARASCLFERALKDYFLVVDIWQMYTTYVSSALGNIPTVVIPVFERAVRNCPWSGAIWGNYIRFLEKSKKSLQEIQGIFEKALTSGLRTADDFAEPFNAFLDFLKRNLVIEKDGSVKEENAALLRNTLQRYHDYFQEYFPDNLRQILIHWAHVEAKILKDVKRWREACEGMVKGTAKELDSWLTYIELEQYHGDINATRSLFKRACHSVRDYPERLWQMWLQFERDYGTLEQWELARDRINATMQEVNAHRLKEQMEYMEQQQAAAEKKTKGKGKGKGREKPQRDTKKRAAAAEEEEAADVPSKKKQKLQISATSEEQAAASFTKGANPKTVFVVNLPFSVDETQLKETFSKFGEVTAVRLVKYKDGKSKGFAYVDFDTEESAKAALALDQTELKGRTLKVSLSSPPVKDKQRDQPDSFTAFVSNLSPFITEEVLRETFASCGTIKEIRLVKERSGKPKGFAYIDFGDENALNLALQLDQSKVKGQSISVAKSRPTKERKQSEDSKQEVATEDSKATVDAPKMRMPVPRVMRKTTAAAPVGSNEEFRKKFLGK